MRRHERRPARTGCIVHLPSPSVSRRNLRVVCRGDVPLRSRLGRARTRAENPTRYGVVDELPTDDQVATDLRRFAIGGGFREMRPTDALDRLVGLACVDARARRDGIGNDEALRAIVTECLDEQLDDERREAMSIFLQTRVSGYGRDLGVRRERAGRMLTSRRPGGLSGRTWEREYEVSACRLVARGLRERELAVRRRPRPSPAVQREPAVLAILPLQGRSGRGGSPPRCRGLR